MILYEHMLTNQIRFKFSQTYNPIKVLLSDCSTPRTFDDIEEIHTESSHPTPKHKKKI